MKYVFTRNLLNWNIKSNRRVMPWKGEKDPYRIWLSEVILQQTRVDQGLAYYNKFITAFASIHDLAKASEQEVFKLWEGLGYYSRCRNLIATAKFISVKLDGRFPDSYTDIRGLKGIGSYTAAAIASFAYNLPYAVVDGNVLRVISRYFGISTPVDTTFGRKLYNSLADSLLSEEQPAVYNQAIMDFGAQICKPKQPLCGICVQQNNCQAYKYNWIHQLPVKEKLLKKKTRWFYYFMIQYNDHMYIRKRAGKDIWQNLYEFVLKEYDSLLSPDMISMQRELKILIGHERADIIHISKVYRQQLTHQTIVGQFIQVKIYSPAISLSDYKPVLQNEIVNYPFPKFITSWLAQKPAF